MRENRGIGDLVNMVLVLIIGGAALGGGFYLYQTEQEATGSAVKIEGEVLSSEVRETSSGGSPSTGSSEDKYEPVIRYRYTYEGETYTSNTLCPGEGEACGMADLKSDRGEVADMIEEYPEGESVTVYVPEDDPEGAYLDGDDSGSIWYIGVMGVGVLILVAGLRDIVKKFGAGD